MIIFKDTSLHGIIRLAALGVFLLSLLKPFTSDPFTSMVENFVQVRIQGYDEVTDM